MKRSRTIRPATLVWLVLTACLVSLIVWLIAGDGEDGTSNNPDQSISTNGTAPAGENPPEPSVSADPDDPVASLVPAVSRFVEVFYYRDASLTVSDLRQRLSPLVTASFLEQNPPDFSTESDQWVRENDGVIEASAIVLLSDVGTASRSALVTVEITVVGTADDQTEPPYVFSIQLEIVWQDGWKVAAFA